MRWAWGRRGTGLSIRRLCPSTKTWICPSVSLWGLGLLALVVRAWKLGDQSLWFDEAMTVFWASHPVSRILQVGLTLSQDPHPPLYYLVAKLFLRRPYEVWLRVPSVMWGVLLVLVWAHWARTRVGTLAGWFVGLFLALSPILVWYSQEARMYAQAMALLALAWWAWSQGMGEGKARGLVSYVLAMVAAVYSYLLSLLWMPAHGLLWLWRRRWDGKARAALVALLVTGGSVLPLAWRAWRGSGRTVPPHPVHSLGDAFWQVWRAWWLWKGHLPGGLEKVFLAATLLVLVGLVLPLRKGVARRWVVAGLIPLLVGVLLAWRDPIVLVEPRYLMVGLPGVVLAWGYVFQAVDERVPRLGWGLAALFLLTQVWTLPANWAPENRREDWRYAARYVASHAGPKDAVLVHPDYVRVALDVYLDALAPSLPRFTPFHDYVRPEDVAPPLEGLMSLYETLWFVESHTQTFDPHHLVRSWLAQRFPLVTEQYPHGVTLQGYALHYRFPTVPPHIPAVSARFANGMELVGCRVWESEVEARDDRAHPPSGWVHVSTYWRVPSPLSHNVFPRLRLADARGVWGDMLSRSTDTFHRYPPTQWLPHEVVREEGDVNLNPATPDGVYTLLVGLEGEERAPIPLEDGSPWFVCGQVRVRNR